MGGSALLLLSAWISFGVGEPVAYSIPQSKSTPQIKGILFVGEGGLGHSPRDSTFTTRANPHESRASAPMHWRTKSSTLAETTPIPITPALSLWLARAFPAARQVRSGKPMLNATLELELSRALGNARAGIPENLARALSQLVNTASTRQLLSAKKELSRFRSEPPGDATVLPLTQRSDSFMAHRHAGADSGAPSLPSYLECTIDLALTRVYLNPSRNQELRACLDPSISFYRALAQQNLDAVEQRTQRFYRLVALANSQTAESSSAQRALSNMVRKDQWGAFILTQQPEQAVSLIRAMARQNENNLRVIAFRNAQNASSTWVLGRTYTEQRKSILAALANPEFRRFLGQSALTAYGPEQIGTATTERWSYAASARRLEHTQN